jgi:hypothetical protein
MVEFSVRISRRLEHLVDRITEGLVLPSEDRRTIVKLTSALQPIRTSGALLVGRDGRSRKTIIIAPKLRLLEKRKGSGWAKYVFSEEG